MILIDPRRGSERLEKPLRALGLPVRVEWQTFGDVVFQGKGEGGCPIAVGIEYKTLSEIMERMNDGHFSGFQLQGMRDCFDDLWLFIEGAYQVSSKGFLLVPRGRRFGPLPGQGRKQVRYSRLKHWRLSQQIRGGVNVEFTRSLRETCLMIQTLYQWWTFAPLETHSSHLQTSMKQKFVDATGLLPAGERLRMLAQIDGLSKVRAAAALKHFKSVRRAANATVKDWEQVPGIGKTLALHSETVMSQEED